MGSHRNYSMDFSENLMLEDEELTKEDPIQWWV